MVLWSARNFSKFRGSTNVYQAKVMSMLLLPPQRASEKVCVDKIGSWLRGILCVDKIGSVPQTLQSLLFQGHFAGPVDCLVIPRIGTLERLIIKYLAYKLFGKNSF